MTTHAGQHAPTEHKTEPKPAPALVEVDAASAEAPALLLGEPRAQPGGWTDPRLPAMQRQTFARRAGQRLGNRQLARALAFQRAPLPDAGTAISQPQITPDTAPAWTPSLDVAPVQRAAMTGAPPAIQRGWVDSVTNAVSSAASAVADPRGAALTAIAGFARNLPGYSLLALVLGRDPITGQTVARTPKTVFQAALGLVPGGSLIFNNLNESGAIDKAFTWLEGQFAQLGLGWDAIKGLFQRAWDAISISDFVNPSAVWERLKGIFLEPISRIKNFVVSAANKVLEFIFEGVLEKLGGGQVLAMLRQAGAAFLQIVKDPIGFLKNLLAGVKQGLLTFVTNIGTHLKQGLISWLFGALAQSGLELPKSFDLKGILALVLQVLGLTWQAIRRQAVKMLGEKVVGTLEKTFGVFKIIQEKGLGGLWEYLKEQLGNLKEMVLGGVKDLVISQVIQAGIQWLIGLLGGPAGAVIKAIQTIYNVVTWIMDNAGRLAALVQAVVGSFQAIAAGAIDVAAQRVEQALARTVPVVIGFLAKLLGLGDLGAKIKALIQKIQAPIQKGIDWLLGKAKGVASKLFGKAKSALTPNETEAQKQQRLEKGVQAGVGAVERLSGNSVTGALINPVLGAVRLRYRLGVLEATVQEGYWTVRGELQRMAKKTSKKAGPPVTLTLPTTLAAHENVAGPGQGHTKAKHVAKDDAFLRQRLINEISPPIPAATTFADEAAAEALINAHLTAQQTAIETWLKSASGAPHVIKAPAPGAGQGFKRPAVNPLDAAAIAAQPKATFDKIRIVLRKGGPAGWYILTAMPDF